MKILGIIAKILSNAGYPLTSPNESEQKGRCS